MTVLTAEVRSGVRKSASRALRRSGRIPAVCYGRNNDPVTLSLDPEALARILRGPYRRNSAIQLQVSGNDNQLKVMVKELQRDPLSRNLLHADLIVVTDDDLVTISVPIKATGKSAAEEQGGRIYSVRRTMKLRCAVRDIPVEICHDISELELGDRVRASEVTAPEGCTIDLASDYVVLQFVIPRSVDEDEVAEEGDEEEEAEAEAVE